MAAPKITYEDKELNQPSPLPKKKKVTDLDMNEIKTVVNAHADLIDSGGSGGASVVYNVWDSISIPAVDKLAADDTYYFYSHTTEDADNNTWVMSRVLKSNTNIKVRANNAGNIGIGTQTDAILNRDSLIYV